VQDVEGRVPERNGVALGQKRGRDGRRVDLYPERGGLLVGPLDEGHRRLVGLEPLSELLLKKSAAEDVIHVGVGEEQVTNVEVALVDNIQHLPALRLGLATRVDEHGLALVVAEVAVRHERAEGKGLDLHPDRGEMSEID
jgi:hypothetical protein